MGTFQRGAGEQTGDGADGSRPAPRSVVLDRLTGALGRTGSPTAVLAVDLDVVRTVGTSRGEDGGERLLAAVAARLAAVVSARETVVRSGDEEFVVICQDTGEHSAYALACFLRNTLSEPFRIDGDALCLAVSIGVAASSPTDAVTAADLLRRAETAVHAGARTGRGRVHVHDPALADERADRHALAADLPAALAAGALDVEYQPVVDLRTGAVVGLEALARWRHPRRGAVPPETFVGVAETTGLAPDLDRAVIQRALQDMAELREAGAVPADAHLAVNLSATHLTDPRLVEDLRTWTRRAGLPAGLLVLELTETALMHDPQRASRLLRRLRGHGFRVAMDDFGTGYSSLSYLRELHVSALKIDRSFVADIAGSPDALAIVAWILDLARAVGVTVVAEGVETAEQADLLRGLGCPAAQGWFWSPAVPPATLLGRQREGAPAPVRSRPVPRTGLWPVGSVSRPALRFSSDAGPPPDAVDDAG